MAERRTLLVLTDAYPFGHSENFFEDELEVLRKRFEKVVVVPSRRCDWSVPELATPPGVEAHAIPFGSRLSMLKHALRSMRASPLLARWLLKEALARPDIWLEPRGWHLLLWFSWHAARTYEDARRAMSVHGLQADSCVVYAYWSWPSALSAVLLQHEFPALRSVSRCHGGDLYEERQKPAYLPYRRLLARELDLLAFISQQGLEYFENRWNTPREKLKLARLGVFDPGARCAASATDVLEVVSCSFAVGVKRLPLMMQVMRELSTRRRVRWSHIGGGPLFVQTKAEAERMAGGNLEVRFTGHLDPREVTRFYVNNPADVFLNTSESEGVPVSIMEAFSCGLPAVAPAVGGVPEIVDDTCGRLFEPDAGAVEIARCVELVAADRSLRDGARARWSERYDAAVNFTSMLALLQRPESVTTE